MSIDLFDTRVLLQAVEELLPPRSFLRDTFFGRTVQSEAENVDVDVFKGKRRVAPYVSPTEEGIVVKRDGFKTDTYTPPYIKVKRVTTAYDLNKRRWGETVYSTRTPMQRMADQISLDLMELDNEITRAEELQCAQALTTGEVILRNGNTLTFPMDSTHQITLTGTSLWTDTTNSHPLAKLREWRRLLIKDSGIAPKYVLLGSSVVDALLNHPDIKGNTSQLSMVKVQLGQINPQLLPNGVTYWGYLTDIACDLYSYDEWYIDNDTQTETAMFPVGKIVMLPGGSDLAFYRGYGAIQDIQSLAAVPRFPKSWEQDDPSVRYIMMQSAPLMIPEQVDAYMYATVV